MVQYCVAYGCKEASRKGSSTSFHSFPTNENLKRKWILRLRRANFQVSKHSRLCSKHFTPECFDTEAFGIGRKLKKDAVPSIFDFEEHFQDHLQNSENPKDSEISSSHFDEPEMSTHNEISRVQSAMPDEINIYETDQQEANEEDFIAEDQSNNIDESDMILSEDVPLTLEVLINHLEHVTLPSRLWGVQKHPKGRFVAFSRMPLQFVENQVIADKVVILTETLIPAVFFKETRIILPSAVSRTPLQSLQQVSEFLEKIQRLAFCTSEEQDYKCRIYLDIPSSVGYCSKCTARYMKTLDTQGS